MSTNIPSEFPLEQRRIFLRNYNKLCALFSQEDVDEGLMNYSTIRLLDLKYVPLTNASGRSIATREPYGPHQYLGRRRTYYRFTNEAGWEKSVYTECEVYLVPYDYQGHNQVEHIIKPCLAKRVGWLFSEFKVSIYEIQFYENGLNELYVQLDHVYSGHKCLYVPIQALLDRDVDAILNRNESYLKWYTKRDDVWNAMKDDPVVIRFLERVRG